MVAYSFQKSFAAQVEQGLKRQTVRLPRRRHAMPGEKVQLYTGMRTRACRKLLDPDPVCLGVSPVIFEVVEGGDHGHDSIVLEVNACTLKPDEAEAFAVADGFSQRWWGNVDGLRYPYDITPLTLMALWWRIVHGPGRFAGYLITWGPA